MPNPFAAAALSAMIAATPAPELLQRCATALSPQQQDTLLTPPRKQKDPHRRFMTIDVSCPLGQADGKMDIIKKNAAGDIIVASFTYKAGVVTEYVVDWGVPNRAFKRLVDLKRNQISNPAQTGNAVKRGRAMEAQTEFFEESVRAIDAVKAEVCDGEASVRTKALRQIDANRAKLNRPAQKHERLKSHFDKR